NIKWQDGTPFTSDDLLFAFNTRNDPDLLTYRATSGRPDLMVAARAPDATTFVVHWSAVYAFADRGQALEPMPTHLVRDLYLRDKKGFENTSYWNDDFVGLGPYRLARWERGSQMVLDPFDDYF